MEMTYLRQRGEVGRVVLAPAPVPAPTERTFNTLDTCNTYIFQFAFSIFHEMVSSSVHTARDTTETSVASGSNGDPFTHPSFLSTDVDPKIWRLYTQ